VAISAFFDYPEGGEERAEEFTLLPQWTDEDWRMLLAHTTMQRFRRGEVVLRRGDSDRALYFVTAGYAEVAIGTGRRQQKTLVGAGSLLGEMAFFDGSPRSADVGAATDVEVLRLPPEEFEAFAARHPGLARDLLLDLGRLLALRLRTTQTLLTT
jgi:CRP/FNR family transcriptional regulator, cyclic AMP receptor protein